MSVRRACFESFEDAAANPLRYYRDNLNQDFKPSFTPITVKAMIVDHSKKLRKGERYPSEDVTFYVQLDFGKKLLVAITQKLAHTFVLEDNVLTYKFKNDKEAHDVMFNYNLMRGLPYNYAQKFKPMEGLKFDPRKMEVITENVVVIEDLDSI